MAGMELGQKGEHEILRDSKKPGKSAPELISTFQIPPIHTQLKIYKTMSA